MEWNFKSFGRVYNENEPLLMRQLSNYHIKQDSFTQTILGPENRGKSEWLLVERKLLDFFLFPWTYIL